MNKTVVSIGEPRLHDVIKATIKHIADLKVQRRELAAIREVLSPGFKIESGGYETYRASSRNANVYQFLYDSIGARLEEIDNELKQWEGVARY